MTDTIDTDNPDKVIELSELTERPANKGQGRPKGYVDPNDRKELFKQLNREARDEVALEGITEQEKAFGDAIVGGESFAGAYVNAYPEILLDEPTPNHQRLYQLGARLAKKPAVRAYLTNRLDEEEGDISHTSARLNNFILKRLEEEAVTARTDGARLKALELLAKHKAIAVTEDLTSAKAKAERSTEDVLKQISEKIEKLTSTK